MFTLKRKSQSMPSPAEALPGRADAIPTASNHFVNGARSKAPIRKDPRWRCSGLAASGVPRKLFWEHSRRHRHRGRLCRRRHAPIPPMRKSAPAAPATTRPCSWSSILAA